MDAEAMIWNIVVMTYTFKFEELMIWEKIPEEEEQKFIDWLTEKGHKPIKIARHYKEEE